MKKSSTTLFSKLVVFTFFSVSLPALTWGVNGTITSEIIVNLKSVSQPRLDPTCQSVAYVLHIPRSDEDEPGRRYSEIWTVPLKGGEPRQFTSKPVNSWAPLWSPDGKSIFFLSKRENQDESTQIYQIPVDGGEARILTHHETDILNYRWSPDGNWIAFTAIDAKTEEEKIAEKEGRDWKIAGENNKLTRLWLYNKKTGKSKQLFKNDLNVWNFRWTPNSRSIVFQATDSPGADPSLMFKRIYRVALQGGRPEKICETKGKLGDMAISPNGEYLAFLGAVSLNDPLAQSVFLVPMAGGEPASLTEGFKESIVQVNWMNNQKLLLLSNRGAQTSLSTLNLRNARRIYLVDSEYVIQSIDWNFEKGVFSASASTPQHPREIFGGSVDSDELFRLTHHYPEIESLKLAKQEVVEWRGPDDLSIEGVLTYPLKYRTGRQSPLILLIHGGPEGVSQNGWTTSSLSPVQLLAAEGYLVLQPNYRGSGGRGVEFSKGDHNDLGGKEFEDVLSGIDLLINMELADPDRIGIAGWSYGGYFSAWAATRYSERFQAAIVCAGLTNWISFTGTTDIPYEMSLVHWNSWWFDVPELHWERSPLSHIQNSNTPTLVIHGLNDRRVHPEQGMELYQALRIKGIPTQQVLYPREPHGLNERAHRLDYMERILGWFDRYVKSHR